MGTPVYDKECRAMKRAIFLCAVLAASTAMLGAQQTSQSGNPYQGVSTPPPNDTIVDETPQQPAPPAKPQTAPAAKPSPDHYPAPITAASATAQQQTAPANRVPPDFINSAEDGTDAGIVQAPLDSQPGAAPSRSPLMTAHLYASDPDGDIVHPQPLPPGELGAGTRIRVSLLSDLASGINQAGDTFRSRVMLDVLEDGSVMIPMGSEIDGRVARVSSGEGLGSDGSMTLHPETVILPDGTRYQIYAMVAATPGSHTRVGREGEITPGLQVKRDGMWYGAGVGTGAATGAILGGPAGALAGTVIGVAAVTVHLLVSHPQAKLDSGSIVDMTLSQPLNLVPVTQKGN
jgi:hypothetical protein